MLEGDCVMKTLVERTQALIDNPQFRVTDTVASLLLAKISELEKDKCALEVQCYELGAYNDALESERPARDLEQQAKGVKSFANSCLGDDILNHKNLALKYASLIHAQAQALKEQGFHFNEQE
jgi:hypothetical protein